MVLKKVENTADSVWTHSSVDAASRKLSPSANATIRYATPPLASFSSLSSLRNPQMSSTTRLS